MLQILIGYHACIINFCIITYKMPEPSYLHASSDMVVAFPDWGTIVFFIGHQFFDYQIRLEGNYSNAMLFGIVAGKSYPVTITPAAQTRSHSTKSKNSHMVKQDESKEDYTAVPPVP